MLKFDCLINPTEQDIKNQLDIIKQYPNEMSVKDVVGSVIIEALTNVGFIYKSSLGRSHLTHDFGIYSIMCSFNSYDIVVEIFDTRIVVHSATSNVNTYYFKTVEELPTSVVPNLIKSIKRDLSDDSINRLHGDIDYHQRSINRLKTLIDDLRLLDDSQELIAEGLN